MKTLDILKTISYEPVNQKEISENGTIPVYSQSKKKLEGYINDENKQIMGPALLFGDHTSELSYIYNNFSATTNCKILKLKSNNNLYYLYTYLNYKLSRIDTSDYGRHFKLLKDIDIPFIDKDKQNKIGSFP